MAELLKYDDIGAREVTFKTTTSGSGFTKITTSHIGLLACLSADETAMIANAASAYRPILGKITAVREDNYVTISTGGFIEVLCGETITVASEIAGNLTGQLATASGYLYAVTASYALAKGGNYLNSKLIKGGSTSTKAIILLN